MIVLDWFWCRDVASPFCEQTGQASPQVLIFYSAQNPHVVDLWHICILEYPWLFKKYLAVGRSLFWFHNCLVSKSICTKQWWCWVSVFFLIPFLDCYTCEEVFSGLCDWHGQKWYLATNFEGWLPQEFWIGMDKNFHVVRMSCQQFHWWSTHEVSSLLWYPVLLNIVQRQVCVKILTDLPTNWLVGLLEHKSADV